MNICLKKCGQVGCFVGTANIGRFGHDSFTGRSGGNLIDGLLPVCNSELRFLENPRNIFGYFFLKDRCVSLHTTL